MSKLVLSTHQEREQQHTHTHIHTEECDHLIHIRGQNDQHKYVTQANNVKEDMLLLKKICNEFVSLVEFIQHFSN